MTLAASWYLLAGLVAAAAVVVLHFLARERPPALLLPTARFVPRRPARAPSRSARPSDLLLLALRVLAVLAAALALAQPSVVTRTVPLVRIVMVERSRAVSRPAAAYDSARAWLRPGDRLLAYDTAAAPLDEDSLAAAPAQWTARGSLTAALVAALRAAAEVAPRTDSLELVLVSPLASEGFDAATPLVRERWRGAIRVVPVPADTIPVPATVAITPLPGDDPLAATITLLGPARGAPAVRVVRTAGLAPADSQFAAAGGAVVVWPAAQGPGDTIGAVAAMGARSGAEAVVVAPFVRTAWPFDSAGAVIARWVDGTAAAGEAKLGAGCVRHVAVPVPEASDLPLTPAMRRFVARLTAPCGGPAELAPLGDSAVARLAGSGGAMASSAVERAAGGYPPLSLWLLLAVAALLLGETALRRRMAAT